MRMRPKKNREPRLKKVENFFAAVDGETIDIDASFDKKGPLWLEIGCGKGAFAEQMSLRHPDVNYLAVEKVIDVLLMAMEKASKSGCSNLKFCNCDVQNICVLLNGTKVDRMFINFCDPWPKKRNAKRRLTSPLFLEMYKTILKENARIFFKTDNTDLFAYSLEQFAKCGYTLENVCTDLHASVLNDENIETEYEKNFSEKGVKIKYLEAYIK